MSKTDYYTVLDLAPSCTLQDVRQSFKKLALKWHPDKCLDKYEAQRRFSEINEAYNVLSDDRKKKIYDTYGHDGIALDQEGKDPANPKTGNIFFQKGFQGTDKSAFDVLRDIFEEKEDDFFSQTFNDFGISDNFKTSFEAFVNESVFCNETDRNNSFFDNYTPTFMNPDFFMSPPVFGEMNFNNNCTTHVFSFLSTNSGEQTFSRTSSTTFQDGIYSTSTKNIYQNGKGVFENAETREYKENNYSTNLKNNKLYDPIYTPTPKDSSFIVIDPAPNCRAEAESFNGFSFEEFNKEFAQALNTGERINSPSKKITKNKESLRLINKKPSKKNKN
jgi:curved DNA-binding protein CbpA